MIIDLINNYKEEYSKILEQIKINKMIDELFNSLESQEVFNNLNFIDYKMLFQKSGYSEDEISVIFDQNFVYVKENNLLSEYSKYLKETIAKIENLKKEVISEESCLLIIEQIDALINTINDPNLYIENIALLFGIFSYYNIRFKDIENFMKEVNEHNEKALNNRVNNYSRREEIVLNNLDTIETEVVSNTDQDISVPTLLDNIINSCSNFSELEKNILTNYYNANKEEFESKYNYLKDIKELSDILNNISKNRQLFIVLMVLADKSNITNVINLLNTREIKIQKMLPHIFVNKDVKFNLDDFTNIADDNEFYQLFSGAYQDFVNNINILSNNVPLAKVNPLYFITDTNLIKNNFNILANYKFDLNINSIDCIMIKDLQKKLDMIIEADLLDYFRQNPKLLMEIDDSFFYRIKYVKDNNITYKRRFLDKKLTTPNGYNINENNYLEKIDIYVSPYFETLEFEEIEKYQLISSELYPIIEILDSRYLREDGLAYNIDSVIISRNKVINLFQKFIKYESLNDNKDASLTTGILFAILKYSLLNLEETKNVVISVLDELKKHFLSYYLTDEKIQEILTNLFPNEDILNNDRIERL